MKTGYDPNVGAFFEHFRFDSQPGRLTGEHWDLVEDELGFSIPTDYKEIVTRVGAFQAWGFVSVTAPGCENLNLNLLETVKSKSLLLRLIKEGLEEIRQSSGLSAPYEINRPVWPEPNGLVSWGYTDNADALSWDPVTGHILLTERNAEIWEEYDETFASWMMGLASGRLVSRILPDDVDFADRHLKCYR